MSLENLAKQLAPLIERVRTDVTATRTDAGHMIWTKEALTETRLRQHLGDGRPRGVCPIRAGESTTRVAVFDLDSHRGETPWPEMLAATEALVDALERHGARPTAFRSSGGRGVHVILLWEYDQDAYSVRATLTDVLAGLGFKNGAKGVSRSEIEIFPKQDAVEPGGFGNQFILPLHNKSALLEPLLGYEDAPRGTPIDWQFSRPVPTRERPVRESRAAVIPEDMDAELKRLRTALAAIPNDDVGDLDYDEWRNIVAGISDATDGSPEGYELAYEFSARHPLFDERELEDKVWAWAKPGKAGGITAATVYARARSAGWNDVSADDFEALPVPQARTAAGMAEGHDLSVDLPLPNLQRDKNGKIEATVNNLRACMARIDVCGMEIRYDEFQDEVLYCERGAPGEWQRITDEDNFELRCRLGTIGFKPISRELMRDAINYTASRARFDTAMLWLDGLVWDGVPRIDTFLSTYFEPHETMPVAYVRAVSAYWWTAMAGRVLSPGCQADMAPILISPKQGLRKSSAIASMVPPDTHRVLNFNQPETERSRLMRGCLSAELAELHGLKTKAKEEIRAWITKRHEEWTPKFKEKSVRVPRRCIFVGSSNPSELFEEFERRWLPVLIGAKIDVEGIGRDRDQLWAEARERWSKSGVAWKDAEDLLADVQGAFRVVDTWEEALGRWAGEGEVGARPRDVGFTLREALVEALGFSDKAIKRGDEMRAGAALRHTGLECKVVWREGKSVRRWVGEEPEGGDLA